MRNRVYAYITYTWLLALLLHSFVLGLFVSPAHDGNINVGSALVFLFYAFFGGLFYSLPVVLLAMFFLRVILFSSVQRSFVAFLAWILSTWISILVFPCILSLLFLGELVPGLLMVFTPALIASTIAFSIRFTQFEKLFFLIRRKRIFQPVKVIA